MESRKTVKSMFDFESELHDQITLNKAKHTFIDCDFESGLSIQGKKFDKELLFVNCRFYDYVKFSNCQFDKPVSFNSCSFLYNETGFSMSECTINQTFSLKSNIFNCPFNASYCKFTSKIVMKLNDICHNTKFDNCIFDSIVKFGHTFILSTFRLLNSKFNGITSFSNSIIQGKVIVKNTEFDDKVFFNYLEGKKGGLSIQNSDFQKSVYFDNSILKSISIRNITIDRPLSFLEFRSKSADRETYRIIKDQLMKQNDKVEALKYYSLEMKQYNKDLRENIFSFNMTNTSENIPAHILPYYVAKTNGIQAKDNLRKVSEFLLLLTNQLSNANGLSWSRGVLFFIVTTMFCFILFIYSMESIQLKNLWAELSANEFEIVRHLYPRFINPTHNIRFLRADIEIKGLILGSNSIMIDLLGRIISTYSIYQIVQAFRKYGKG
ncbi:MAG: pentapeptide repeat-containing protein [Hyphomicrobiales bacterium]